MNFHYKTVSDVIPTVGSTMSGRRYNTEMERREGKITSIREMLDRNIILKGADVLTTRGYTQVPNHVLVNDRLSPGAKLTYAMLLKYAWQHDYCFPGQERLAVDIGVTRQSANAYIQELQHQKFINIQRRGQGKTNLYVLNLNVTSKRHRNPDVKKLYI